jgi:predicted cupin superfamily sugar epimerase
LDATYWIRKLALTEHPEGGHYRETYRSERTVPAADAARGYPAGRSFSTAIYYLLRYGEVSRLHRLRSDEVFHHYEGSAFVLHVFDRDGSYRVIRVGDDPERGEAHQAVVRAGSWFGATVERPGSFSLVGCTVAPGFEFTDFELADRTRLLESYPEHRPIIERLT